MSPGLLEGAAGLVGVEQEPHCSLFLRVGRVCSVPLGLLSALVMFCSGLVGFQGILPWQGAAVPGVTPGSALGAPVGV